MKEELKLMIELQKLELSLRDMERRRRELPQQLAGLAQEQAVFQNNVEECRKKHDELVKKRLGLENTLKRDAETLKKTRDRLYEVKTNKEYQAILKEIETAETKISELESGIIALMEEIDQQAKTLKTREQESAARLRQYEEKKNIIEKELSGIDEERERLLARGGELRSMIPADLLKKFDTIKAANSGLALASVWKAVCGGCYMNIPAQLYIDLQKNLEMTLCPNCQRIIYWYDQSNAHE